MTDQLSLDLEPDLPLLPATLRPMLPRTAPEPFDSPDHLFEPSWAGERALAFVESANARVPDRERFRLVDRRGRDLAFLLPELADLPMRLEARSAVIDGELVVVDPTGRADPAALRERLLGRSGLSVAYLVFDLLYLDGRPLIGGPLFRRREQLRRTLHPSDAIVVVPAIASEGRALHEAVVSQGIAGVMGRHRSSPYLPGVRSRLWQFVSGQPGRRQSPPPEAEAEHADAGSATAGAAPVLALIRRLPLDEES